MLNINRELYVILLLIFYVSAIYRSAILISIDTGPLGIFEWIRSFVFEKQASDKLTIWDNIYEGINCTDCTGIWMAFVLGMILIASFYWDYASIIIFILGGAGFQHYITNRDNGEDELIV